MAIGKRLLVYDGVTYELSADAAEDLLERGIIVVWPTSRNQLCVGRRTGSSAKRFAFPPLSVWLGEDVPLVVEFGLVRTSSGC
jgi:hypothetical protein